MAESFYTGGSAGPFSFAFKSLKATDVRVSVDGVDKTVSTHYTISNYTTTGGGQITFTSGNVPTGTQTIRIYRQTSVAALKATFAAGSSIKSEDLNENFEQLRLFAEDPIGPNQISNHSITSAKIANGTIVDEDISATAAIDGTKVDPNFGSQNVVTTGTAALGATTVTGTHAVTGNITVSGTVDGRDVAADGQKLDTIETGATADQTDAEIRAAVEAATDSNVFTDADHTKLNGIEAGATGDQTNAEIRAAVEAAGDSNVFTDADHAKLNGIEAGATADQTAAEIKQLYESNANTNEFNDGEKSKLAGIEAGATADQTAAEIKSSYESNSNTNEFNDAEKSKLAGIEAGATQDQTGTEIKGLYEGNTNTNAFTDAEKTKLSGIAAGAEVNVQPNWTETNSNSDAFIRNAPVIVTNSQQASHTPSDTKFLSSSASDGRYFRQDSSETIASGNTWSSGDGHVATTAAIDARIIDLIDDVGGFTPIANETSFPSTNPQGNTGTTQLVSIKALSATLTPSSNTVTIANGAGTGNTVTITGVTQTLPVGFGVIVETTGTLHTYAFHRLQPKATEVTAVATNITNVVAAGTNSASINNFADRYRVSPADPTARADGSSLQEGDLYYNTAQDVMKAYNGSSYDKITPDSSQLNDIAVVANDISTSSDLGSVSDSLIAGGSGGAVEVVADTLEGAATFVITVSGGKFVVDGVQAPVLSLRKGWTYTFDQSHSSNNNHPLRFTSGGSAYSTGVTTQGSSVIFKVPDAATNLAYICQNHSGMGNSITVIEDPITANQDNAANITAVANNASNITAVAGNATNINAVQGNASNINAVAGNASNITAVANNETNIDAVAGNATNINAVAGNATNINAVKNNASNINAVAGNATNINAVQANASNINTVAGINANVTTVAGISGNVTTVAGNTSNINSVHPNSSNINTVAGSIGDVNRYADEYQISANAPSSPSAGDLWFDTTSNTLKNYNGSAWLGITSNSGIQNVSDDSTPELAGALDCNNNNLTEVGTVSGNNLQIDFGTL